MQPRLSVIIPCRNGLETLPRAVASALALPIAELEVIVVDDGSTDGTTDWLEAESARDPRVVMLRRTQDHGASQARNAGIAIARAPLLGFLDADDVWHAAGIARRLAWHEAHPGIVMSFANYATLLPDGTVQPRYLGQCPRFRRFLGAQEGMVELGKAGFALIAAENPVCTSSVIVRCDAVQAAGGFDTSLRQVEDWDLWIRLARTGEMAASTGIELYHADRPGSLSHHVAERVSCLRRVVLRHRIDVMRRAPGAAMAGMCLLQQAEAELAMREGRDRAAFRHLAAALAWQPTLPHARDAARALLVLAGLKPSLTTVAEALRSSS